jgi:hypothetical protein
LAHRANDFFKKLNPTGQLRQLSSGQLTNGGRELSNATRSPCRKDLPTLWGGANHRQPLVVLVADTLDEAILFQSGNDARHRRRLHLLRGGELTEGEWAAEDDHGQRGKAGSRQAAGVVFLA